MNIFNWNKQPTELEIQLKRDNERLNDKLNALLREKEEVEENNRKIEMERKESNLPKHIKEIRDTLRNSINNYGRLNRAGNSLRISNSDSIEEAQFSIYKVVDDGKSLTGQTFIRMSVDFQLLDYYSPNEFNYEEITDVIKDTIKDCGYELLSDIEFLNDGKYKARKY